MQRWMEKMADRSDQYISYMIVISASTNCSLYCLKHMHKIIKEANYESALDTS